VLDIYVETHKFVRIYKLGDYFFSLDRRAGYLNLTDLKKAI
jgi:hypothetical protein